MTQGIKHKIISKFILVVIVFCGFFIGISNTVFADNSSGQAPIASIASGDWNSTSTWAGGIIPGNGDTVIISNGTTVTIPSGYNAVVGTSPSDDVSVPAIACASNTGNGVLIVNGKLTYRGSVTQCASTWTVNAGAILEHDSSMSASPSSTSYSWKIGMVNDQLSSKLVLAGTSGNRIKVQIAPGSGNSGGFSGNGNLRDAGQLQASYVDFDHMGTPSLQFLTTSPYSSGATTFLDYCRITNSAGVTVSFIGANSTFRILHSSFKLPIVLASASGKYINITSSSAFVSGDRRIQDSFIGASVFFSTSYAQPLSTGYIFDNVVIVSSQGSPVNVPFATGATSPIVQTWRNVLFYNNIPTSSDSSSLPAGTLNRTMLLRTGYPGNPHWTYLSVRDTVLDGFIVEGVTDNGNAGDEIMTTTGNNPYNVTIKNGLAVPTPGRQSPGTFVNHSTANICNGSTIFCPSITVENNTFLGDDTAAAVGLTGESNNGYANIYASVKNNLVWKNTSGSGYILKWHSSLTPVAGAFSGVDYNGYFNLTGTRYLNATTNQYSSTPGIHDVNADPKFVDSSRNFIRWGQSIKPSISTWAEIIDEMSKINDSDFNPNFTVSNAYDWIRAGFVPTNGALKGTGFGGSDIGAMPVSASGVVEPTIPTTPTVPTVPTDSTAPVVSSLSAQSITTNSATVVWTTNEVADGQVEYGLTSAYGSVSGLNANMLISHSINISGLNSNTKYYFRIKSKDAAGNLTTSNGSSFTTTSSASSSVLPGWNSPGVQPSAAGSVPPQFVNLLDDGIDYTANSATWPSPAIPNWGGSYTDPIWKTTLKRVGKPIDCASNCDTDTLRMMPAYSKRQVWNADSSRYLLMDGKAWLHLYDGATNQDLGRISDVKGLVSDNNWRWSNSDPDLIYFWYGMTLKTYRLSTKKVTDLHTFSCDDGQGNACTAMTDGGEGNFSNDDRYFAFIAQYYHFNSGTSGPGTFWQLYAYVYDIKNDVVVAKKSVQEMCGPNCSTNARTPMYPYNWISMSPSGNYVVTGANTGHTQYAQYVRGTGDELFDRNLNYIGTIDPNAGHADIGYDVNGHEVLVRASSSFGLRADAWTISTTRLDEVTPTAGSGEHHVYVPCYFQYSTPCGSGSSRGNGFHVSMRGSQKGSALGWALISTWAGATQGTGWGAAENFAVKIDTSAPEKSAAQWRRISRTFSIRNKDYFGEPHTTANPDFTKIMFGTNWLVDGGQISTYVVDLTSSGVSTDTTAPTIPAGLTATAQSSTQINLSWTPSVDAVGVTGYKVYRGGVQIGTTITNSYSDTGLTASTQYTYTVSAYDRANNNSAQSTSKQATTLVALDTTVPTVSIVSPIHNATVSNTITITASATDPASVGAQTSGVANVVFKLDGAIIGTDTIAPYTQSVNTTALSNGQHILTVRATDGAGNLSSVDTRTIVVSNMVSVPVTPTLIAAVVATPNSGVAPINGVSLTATITGTATGNSNYYFYCDRNDTSTSTASTPSSTYLSDSSTIKITGALCSYSTAGTYTPKVIIQRNGLTSESRTNVIVTAPSVTTSSGNGGGGGSGGGGGGGISSSPVTSTTQTSPTNSSGTQGGNTNSNQGTTQISNVNTSLFTRALSQGMKGDDVRELQKFLIGNGYLPSDLVPTNFFGPLTASAVQKFQCDKNIVCSGSVATTGYGVFGQKTRSVAIGTGVASTSSSGAGTMSTQQMLDLISTLLKQVAQLQEQLKAIKGN